MRFSLLSLSVLFTASALPSLVAAQDGELSIDGRRNGACEDPAVWRGPAQRAPFEVQAATDTATGALAQRAKRDASTRAPILWCEQGDDPRCAPVDQHTDTTRVHSLRTMTPADVQRGWRDRGEPIAAPCMIVAPRSGDFRERLDRPPRA